MGAPLPRRQHGDGFDLVEGALNGELAHLHLVEAGGLVVLT
jgi:hypothetical protein